MKEDTALRVRHLLAIKSNGLAVNSQMCAILASLITRLCTRHDQERSAAAQDNLHVQSQESIGTITITIHVLDNRQRRRPKAPNPVEQRIEYKLSSLCFKIISHQAPI